METAIVERVSFLSHTCLWLTHVSKRSWVGTKKVSLRSPGQFLAHKQKLVDRVIGPPNINKKSENLRPIRPDYAQWDVILFLLWIYNQAACSERFPSLDDSVSELLLKNAHVLMCPLKFKKMFDQHKFRVPSQSECCTNSLHIWQTL